jgi:diaminopimelate decarboxylase
MFNDSQKYPTEKIRAAIYEKGTPLQIAIRDRVEQNILRAREILSPFGWQNNIFYSYKTNPVADVLRVLHECGAGAEVISERELAMAIDLNVPPDRIIFNGIYKSPAALDIAVRRNIRSINIDSPQELDIIRSISGGSTHSLGLRVRPSVGWQGQFGYPISDGSAYAMAENIISGGKFKIGIIHFHLGGNLKFDVYRRAIDEVVAFVDKINKSLGTDVKAIDVGGGFPGREMRMLTLWEQGWLRLWGSPWPFEGKGFDDGFDVLSMVARYFDHQRKAFNLDHLEMLVEPGRLITGDAQVLAVKVTGIRRSSGKNYAVVDGGRVGAAGPLVGETRKAFVLGKESEKRDELYDIVGPTCMPWDRLFAGIKLPKLDIDDILVIEGAGAYFVPMETEFSFKKPKLVLI